MPQVFPNYSRNYSRPVPDAAAYRRAIEAARAVAMSLSETQLRAFMRLLAEYAEELSVRVAAGLATRGQRYALAVAEEVLQQLARDIALSTRNGVTLTARRMAEIHARATIALMQSAGVTPTPVFGALGATTAQAVLARPQLAATFRSIRRDSVEAVDRILTRALLRGAGADAVERELRLHVLGADAFPERLLLDRRRIGYAAIESLGYAPTRANLDAVRRDAARVAGRARLIARTEIMNTEHEASQQAAADSPVVGLIRWRTSQRHPELDQCDALQDVDWYGYGEGRYLPGHVPPRPHPRCLCRTLHEILPVAQWGRPRPGARPRILSVADVALSFALSPSQEASLVAALDAAEHGLRRAA